MGAKRKGGKSTTGRKVAKRGPVRREGLRAIAVTTIPPSSAGYRTRFFNGAGNAVDVAARARVTKGANSGSDVVEPQRTVQPGQSVSLLYSATGDFEEYVLTVGAGSRYFSVPDSGGGWHKLGALDVERWPTAPAWSMGLTYSKDAASPYRPRYRTDDNFDTW